jgi:hypothetical protein
MLGTVDTKRSNSEYWVRRGNEQDTQGNEQDTRWVQCHEPCHFEADEWGTPGIRVVNGGEGAGVSEGIRLFGLWTASEALASESDVQLTKKYVFTGKA